MSELSASESPPWELYYWSVMKDGKNQMIGRGEFIRLMFEVAGVAYIDHGVLQSPSSSSSSSSPPPATPVLDFVRKGGNTGFPFFACPAIKRGSFVLSQTPSIMKYLGKEFGLYPTKGAEDEAHADALMALVTDFIGEGRLVFHAKEFTMSYFDQIEETKPNVDWFEKTRLGQFLNYLEKVLAYNYSTNTSASPSSSLHFIACELTYVDIAVFHALCAAESQFPAAFIKTVNDEEGGCWRLRAFKRQIEEMPRIKEYLKSDRRGLFEGNSMM